MEVSWTLKAEKIFCKWEQLDAPNRCSLLSWETFYLAWRPEVRMLVLRVWPLQPSLCWDVRHSIFGTPFFSAHEYFESDSYLILECILRWHYLKSTWLYLAEASLRALGSYIIPCLWAGRKIWSIWEWKKVLLWKCVEIRWAAFMERGGVASLSIKSQETHQAPMVVDHSILITLSSLKWLRIIWEIVVKFSPSK